MSILAKMITALRGGLNEVGETIVDSQALRILDQEVREAAEELKQSKEHLTEIMAQQKLAEEKCNKLQGTIAEHEDYAMQALDKANEHLAREVAEKIADVENELKSEQGIVQAHSDNVGKLRNAIKQAEGNIKRLKQQVDTVKATESVQRAQSAVAERHSGSNAKLRTAMDSLERIKQKQALKAAQMNAAEEIASSEVAASSLQTKLQEAGIVSTESKADDILARLKKNRELNKN